MAEDVYPVKLHVYDLSQGMARQLSTTIPGKAMDGIWHTGVVVYGREYYYGGGIQQGQPGRTPYGTPVRVEDLGVTGVPREMFEDFLRDIGPRYTPATYNLLSHNCNTFSNEVAQFLAGASVPSYILELPHEVMKSPMGALILPMIQGLEASLRAGAVPQSPQFKPATAAATVTQPPQFTPAPTTATTTPPSSDEVAARSTDDTASKPEAAGKTAGDVTCTGNSETVPLPPAVQPTSAAAAAPELSTAPAAVATTASPEPLVEAKRRAQDEIKREFAAIMVTGTARPGEAAVLATRRVMERHGLQRGASAMQRG